MAIQTLSNVPRSKQEICNGDWNIVWYIHRCRHFNVVALFWEEKQKIILLSGYNIIFEGSKIRVIRWESGKGTSLEKYLKDTQEHQKRYLGKQEYGTMVESMRQEVRNII